MSIGKFSEFYVDVTKDATKIPQEQYLAAGRYPIIDQGQKSIAGMWDNPDGLYEKVPAIVFGDHTRTIKYVDTPFFIGADGVKVLRPVHAGDNVKYLFYVLQAARIPNLGYSRHFKVVKELEIRMYPRKKQDEIVRVLEQIDSLLEQRQNEILQMDILVKSRFFELFYDKGYPVLKWNEVFSTTTGKLDSNAAVAGGEYPFFTCSKETLRIDKYAFEQEALLLAGNNAAGKYDVKYYNGRFNAYQRTYVLELKENWSYRLFQYQLEDKLEYLQQQSLGGLTKYLTLKILGELSFIIPPKELQNEFEVFVAEVDKSKFRIQKSLSASRKLWTLARIDAIMNMDFSTQRSL